MVAVCIYCDMYPCVPTHRACAHTRARYRNWSVLSIGEPQGAPLFCSRSFVLLLFPAPPHPIVLFGLFSKLETRKDEMEEEWEGLCSKPELIFKGYTLKWTGRILTFRFRVRFLSTQPCSCPSLAPCPLPPTQSPRAPWSGRPKSKGVYTESGEN